MKTRIIALIAGLLAVLPVTSAWAGDSYYAALKATVHSSSSGMGKVYAGTGTSAGTFDASSSSSDRLDAGSSGGAKTFYAFAQPEENYEFDKWVADSAASITATQSYGTDGSRATVTVNASTTKNGTATGTVTAYFKKKTLPSFRVSFLPAVNGSYTVDGVAAPFTTGDMTEAYTPKLVATAAEGYAVKHWYTTTDGGATKTVVSTGSSFTGKFTSNVSVGVVFASATKVTTYEGLKEALKVEDAYLEIPAEATITIPAGETVTNGALQTVIINGTTFVDGKFVNNGTVQGGGKVATHVKHVTQSSGLRVAQRWNVSTDGVISYLAYGKSTSAYESYASANGHYHVTTCVDCNGAVQGTFPNGMVQKYVSVDNGTGGFFTKMTTLATPKVIKCSIDSAVAINHVTGISGVYDAITSDVNPENNSGNIVILLADTTCDGFQHSSDASKNSRVYFTGVFDCAGKTFSTYKDQPTSSQAVATFVNGKFKSSKGSYTSHFSFINCSNVDLSSTYLKSAAGTYHFWDCDNATVTITYQEGSESGKMFKFYGGAVAKLTIKGSAKFDANCEVYGGTYPIDPNPESGTFLYNKTYFYADHVGSTYVVKPIEQDDGAKTLAIGSTEYTTLAKAIEGAKDGDVIKIIALSEIDGTVTNGKNITIDLNGYALQGGMIVNTGTISFEDVSTENKGVVSSAIENSGTADFAFGTYSGSIVNKANGVLTTHNGVFTGAVTKEGGTINLKGGHFKLDVSALVDTEKYLVLKDADSRFAVSEPPDGTLHETTVSGHAGYAAKPYPADSDFELLKKCTVDNVIARASYTRDEWRRLGEVMMFHGVYNRRELDVTVKFDRYVPPQTVTVFADAGMSLSMTIGHEMLANELYRELTALIIKKAADFGQTATVGLMYKDLFERNFNGVATAISSKEQNYGTKCDLYIELWQSEKALDHQSTNPHYITNTVLMLSHASMIFGAGSNVAMIRPTKGAATFYPTLREACEAAQNGETVMLCNDCTACEPIANPCSFKFDANGFKFDGEIAAADGYTKSVENGVYTFKMVIELPQNTGTTGEGEEKSQVVIVPDKDLIDEAQKEAEQEAKAAGKDAPTQEEIAKKVQEKLEEPEANGLKVWENKLLDQATDEQKETKVVVQVVEKTVGEQKVIETRQVAVETKDGYDKLEAGIYREAFAVKDDAGNEVKIADTNPEVKSISVVKNTSAEKTIILPVPGEKNEKSEGVSIDNVIAPGSLNEGDIVTYYDGDTKLEWKFLGGEGEDRWEIRTTNNKDGVDKSKKADECTLLAGEAFWLTRAYPEKPVVIVAEVPTEGIEKPVTAGEWNLEANPDPVSEKKLDDVVKNPATGDQIVIPTANGAQKKATLDKEGKWTYKHTYVDEDGFIVSERVPAKVEGGQGFWYISGAAGKETKIKW